LTRRPEIDLLLIRDTIFVPSDLQVAYRRGESSGTVQLFLL
jgi:hypothetical protein